MKKSIVLPILALLLLSTQGFSQDCSTPITNFPWRVSFVYVEPADDVFPRCIESQMRTVDIPYWRKLRNNHFVEASSVATNASTPPSLLFLPPMTIPENASLNFLHRAGLITLGNLLIRDVMISTTDKDPASFTTLASYPNSVMSTTSWNWSAVDLSEYAGQTVYIAFAQRSAMDSWRIQEIVIRDADAEVETRFPENKETKVPTDAVLRVTFDKNVFENDFSKITITPAVTGISARTENNVLYINHNDFQYDTEYTVTIPAETVDYHTGNITWSFRTWLAPIDVASVAVLPEHNATNVALDAAVRVAFDIDVEEDFNFENISISPAVEGVEAFYRNKVLAVFSRNFAPKTTYTVTVPARAIDRLRNDVVWTFTTAEGTATNNQNVFVATEPNVMIWPNPSNGEIHVKVGEKSTVKIFDLNGVQLGLHTVGANSELKLNQTPGVYFIRVENHLGTTAHKVIVQ